MAACELEFRVQWLSTVGLREWCAAEAWVWACWEYFLPTGAEGARRRG